MAGTYVVMAADDGTLAGCTLEQLAAREAYELHSYYEALRDVTFPTEFVALGEAEARAWRLVYIGKQATMAASERELYANLVRRLDDAISQFPAGAFVRLSTRSPKDAPDKLPEARVVAAIAEHARAMPTREPGDLLLAVRKALFDLMRVCSAADALELCSLSSRVISDMRRALEHVAQVPFHMQLIVRAFVPLPLEQELRGFVFAGKLCALSQYSTDLFVPALAGASAAIGVRVERFVEDEVIPRLAAAGHDVLVQACVVDVVLLDDDSLRLVELNPYSEHTGAGLFDWRADAALLRAKPLTVRMVPGPVDHAAAALTPWRSLVDKALRTLG